MNKRAGFTIVELMVTLVIAAIGLTIAIPGFAHFMRSQRATASANEFLVALTFARSEALKRDAPVAVCASSDPQAATPSCSGKNNWTQGWITFVDDDTSGTDGSYDSATETLLRVHPAASGVTITADGSPGPDYVRFVGDGTAENANGNFKVKPTGCTDSQQRHVNMSPTGRADVVSENCS